MKKRVYATFIALVSCFLVICVYTGTLIKREELCDTAHNAASATVVALRGTIYDNQLTPLVNSDKVYCGAVISSEKTQESLKEHLTISSAMRLASAKPGALVPVIFTGPTIPIEGVHQFFAPTRYGTRLLAPHIIGYVDGSGDGVIGLEKDYNAVLNTYQGTLNITYASSATGNVLRGAQPVISNDLDKAKGGLVTTLDSQIQEIVENTALSYIDKGAVVVINAENGDILSMASFPSFQPTSLTETLREGGSSHVNRALASYDCGSVFKIVTAVAALESGVPMETVYSCDGALKVGNTVFHCHNRIGHQGLDMKSAMAQSCNLYFIQLAQEVGAQKMMETAEILGLKEDIKLTDSLVARTPVMPTTQELIQSPAVLANFSFGQGKLLVSPLHIARLTATIANIGRSIQPAIIHGVITEKGDCSVVEKGKGERAIPEETAKKLETMLRLVVMEGTGKQAALSCTDVAGKTGTAETGQINDGQSVINSWFTGYFNYKDTNYVITIMIEDAAKEEISAAALFCEISNNLIEGLK